MAKKHRTPVLVQTDADGNIIRIARGTGIVLEQTATGKGKWHDVRDDPAAHLAQGTDGKKFRVRVKRGKASLEVRDDHEVVNGRLQKKRKKDKQ